MILAIADVLSAADIEAIRAGLANAPFVDGKTTAGWSAKLVKSNLQAGPGAEVERLRALVETRLTRRIPCLPWRPGPRPSSARCSRATSRAMPTARMSTMP